MLLQFLLVSMVSGGGALVPNSLKLADNMHASVGQ